jgi:urease accessory protein
MASDDAGAKVALMPEGALLLSGDAIAIDIFVGPGARLELVEPGGTVAYPMAGGKASWDVTIELAPAASLVWAAEPFVVSEGATVDRRTTIRLGMGACFASRETIVLGRYGEHSGSLRQVLDVTGHGGASLLREQFDVGPESSRLLLGGTQTIGSILVVGRRLPAEPCAWGTRFDLQGEGTMLRQLTTEAHLATSERAWGAARNTVWA